MDDLIKFVEKELNIEQKNIPKFNSGDNIVVHFLIKEGSKERIQKFQGTVIARKNIGTNGETFSVRKISSSGGIGVEKTFSIIAPNIKDIEVISYGKVRRSKLYYLRDRYGKSAVVKEKKILNKKKK